MQLSLSQSVGAAQPFPSPHAGHAPPPQSMSVSLPFSSPSLHVAASHAPPAQ